MCEIRIKKLRQIFCTMNVISAKMIIDNKTVDKSITVKQCDRCQLPIPFLLITEQTETWRNGQPPP